MRSRLSADFGVAVDAARGLDAWVTSLGYPYYSVPGMSVGAGALAVLLSAHI